MKKELRRQWCLDHLLPYVISQGGWCKLTDASAALDIDYRSLTQAAHDSGGVVEIGFLGAISESKILRSGNCDHYAGTIAEHMIRQTLPRNRVRRTR